MARKARANAEWERWGEVDPLWGVASWAGKQAGSADEWTVQEFLELGESDWDDIRSRWERYGLDGGVCLEVGCGAGRLTYSMADHFRSVHGVDVAPAMLAKAASVVSGRPVTLHLGDGLRIPLSDASVDAALSTHVFQHLDSDADAEANWRELFRVLRPGGSVMVHLPVHFWPAGLDSVQRVYELRRRVGDVRAWAQRRRMAKGDAPPIMRGRSVAWPTLEQLLRAIGFTDVELSIFRMRSNDGMHPFVLARKPGQ